MRKTTELLLSILRFRHRHGFGIHAPFAYDLITSTIYATWPYTAFATLQALSSPLPHYDTATNELLFRLVNRLQPQTAVEVGTGSGIATCYMAAAKGAMQVTTVDTQCSPQVAKLLNKRGVNYVTCDNDTWLPSGTIDFVHLAHTDNYVAAYESLLPRMTPQSVMVVEGIYADKAKRQWWRRLLADERTGDTYDLYYMGLVFFDRSHTKRRYKA